MAGRGITIDLKNKPNGSPPTKTYEGVPGKFIKVTGSEFYSDILKYTHADSSGGNQPFHLAKIWDDQNNDILNGHSTIDKVSSVSAYYWKYDNGGGHTHGKALLVQVTAQSGTKYYVRSKNSGKEWTEDEQLSGESLDKKLDELNCKHNSAAVIDLTEGVYDKTREKGHKYCCTYHSPGEAKVTVAPVQVSCKVETHKNPTTITAYKHSIDSTSKIAAIKYNEGGDSSKTKIITASGLRLSYYWCQSIYVLYCNQKNPVLIYIYSGDTARGWYQKKDGGSRDNNEQWEKLSTDLNSIIPDNIKSCNDNDFEQLVTVLTEAGCGGLGKCPPPSPPQAAAPAKFIAGAAVGLGYGVISGISSGTLAGAGGLTGFGWWMFKRSKGDPWVRQI